MAEFRHSNGTIKTEKEIKADNPNTSFPKGALTTAIITDLGYEPVLSSTAPSPSSSTKIVVRDGVEKNSDNIWVYKWKEQDRFADIDGGKTKSEQDAEYQASLDSIEMSNVRFKREALLAEADWQIHKLEDSSGDPSAWRTYRQQLRDITKAEDIHNVTWPTKPS